MSGFVSRWVVRRTHDLGADDFAADGLVRSEVVDRWLVEARDAYLERCSVLVELREQMGLEFRFRPLDAPAREQFGRPTAVVVSAGATELHPDSITLAFRLRPTDGTGDGAINVRSVVTLEDPQTGVAAELGNDVRDELIALEHAAQYTN